MVTHALLSEAQQLIGQNWKDTQSPERAQILGLARDALIFISATGQRYPFEDFRSTIAPGPLLSTEDANIATAQNFFLKMLNESESPRDKELIQLILDLFRFIISKSQHNALADYQNHLESGSVPLVLASFETLEEAKSWLHDHPSPPDFAGILIADRYHDVIYDRETNFRAIPPNNALRYCLPERAEDIPAIASFATRKEAEVWLKAQPVPAVLARVSIGGEPYLALYHANINHRLLHPYPTKPKKG